MKRILEYECNTLRTGARMPLYSSFSAERLTFAAGPAPEWNPRAVLIDDARIERLKQRIERKEEPAYTAFQKLLERAGEYEKRTPHAQAVWFVPWYYGGWAGPCQS